jgi:hypothetical protein
MSPHRFRLFSAATVAGLAISLALSACGPQPGEAAPTAESSATSATATAAATVELTTSATQSVTPTVAPTTEAPAPQSPSATPFFDPAPTESAPPAVPALKTFTFPDGHISFSYPADWSVRTQRGPGLDVPPFQPVEAIVSDAAGNDVFRLASGAYGIGCAGGLLTRVLLDQAPVPGVPQTNGKPVGFGFFADRYPWGSDQYWMAPVSSQYLVEGEGAPSACSVLVTGNGGADGRVIFNEPAFPSLAAAEAWMGTRQYAQLKALITSLKYS